MSNLRLVLRDLQNVGMAETDKTARLREPGVGSIGARQDLPKARLMGWRKREQRSLPSGLTSFRIARGMVAFSDPLTG